MSNTQHAVNNIGISGFQYVLGSNVSKLRRFLWLHVILLASAWMLWNIQGRVTYFLSRPSTITTEMKFKDKPTYPKVTICNQNTFRSSKVFGKNNIPRMSPTLYEALDRYLRVLRDDSGNQSLKKVIVNKYGELLSDQNIKEFYRLVSHQKSSLIQRCIWKGRECGPENFTEVFTNMGLCYQFNTSQDDMIVDKADKDGGLKLRLFVEQYDYMQDPETSPGALVVITDHDETAALAKEQGIGVNVGQSVSIGLQQSEATDLPSPYGSCGTAELDTFPPDVPYTYQKCHLNCLTSFIKRKCGCVSVYMPDQHSPVCTLLTNLDCVTPNEELFYESHQMNKCNCPSPCKSVTYTSTLFLAPLSNPFKTNLALSKPPVSLSDVNRAIHTQGWALLNTVNTGITDTLERLTIALTDYKSAWDRYSSIMSMVVAKLRYLMEFVSKANMTEQVMMAVKPEQDANMTWGKLHSVSNEIERLIDICILETSTIKLWPEVDSSNDALDITIAGDILIYDASTDFPDFPQLPYVQSKIESFVNYCFKHYDLLFNFTSVTALMMQNLNVTKLNHSSLTPNTRDVAIHMTTTGVLLVKHLTTITDQYKTEMETVREIAKHTYNKLTSTFYKIVGMGKNTGSEEVVHELRPKHISDNLLKLEIYFNDLVLQESKKSPAYSVEGLVCDIGGSIGLCLGGSILTLVEVCDLLAILCGNYRKQTSKGLASSQKIDVG